MSTTKPSRKLRSLAYGTATGLTAFVFLSGGAAYLAGASFAVAGVTELGYPRYFVTLLGGPTAGAKIVPTRVQRRHSRASSG